jgi:hypothetical protein
VENPSRLRYIGVFALSAVLFLVGIFLGGDDYHTTELERRFTYQHTDNHTAGDSKSH